MQLDFNKMFARSKYHASIWTMEVTTASVSFQTAGLYHLYHFKPKYCIPRFVLQILVFSIHIGSGQKPTTVLPGKMAKFARRKWVVLNSKQ